MTLLKKLESGATSSSRREMSMRIDILGGQLSFAGFACCMLLFQPLGCAWASHIC